VTPLIAAECRGIVFSPEGKILSRRYHKFFNLEEKGYLSKIDFSQPHIILEKLDGSMVGKLPIPAPF
jgi:hypothetical protein